MGYERWLVAWRGNLLLHLASVFVCLAPRAMNFLHLWRVWSGGGEGVYEGGGRRGVYA
jgi:hypothetical protein